MPSQDNKNLTSQPADIKSQEDSSSTNVLQAVADMEQRQAAESAKLQEKKKQDNIDEIQEKLRKNRAFFYGLPLLVLVYGIATVFLFVVPSIQNYFTTSNKINTLNSNLSNLKTTAANLDNARGTLDDFDKYDEEITSYIPTDSQLGSLLNTIQTKAGDFGLESEVGLPSRESVAENSTVEDLAETGDDSEGLFDSINSGEIEFIPESVSGDSTAKLLAIDVSIRGDKESFFKFLNEMDLSRPIINLVYVDYQELSSENPAGTPTNIRATLRFESYTLKLADKDTQVQKLTTSDSSVLVPITIQEFVLNTEIVGEFEDAFSTPTPTPTQ